MGTISAEHHPRFKITMAFAVNSTKNLLDRFNDLHNIRDIVLLAGLYYTSKFTLKTVGSIWSAIKTFGLPLIWPRNFKEEYGLWAVVTGCSKGIGLCYAKELAKKGMNLVLIARKAELLNKIASEIHTQYGVKVEVIIADFGKGAIIYKDIEAGIAGKTLEF